MNILDQIAFEAGLRCDQTIMLSSVRSHLDYPVHLRQVKFYNATHDKLLTSDSSVR